MFRIEGLRHFSFTIDLWCAIVDDGTTWLNRVPFDFEGTFCMQSASGCLIALSARSGPDAELIWNAAVAPINKEKVDFEPSELYIQLTDQGTSTTISSIDVANQHFAGPANRVMNERAVQRWKVRFAQ